MPTKTRQARSRASPLLGVKVPFAHTQDFFIALRQGLEPKNIEHPILRAIARAIKYQNLSSVKDGIEPNYVANNGKGVWFEFAFVNKDGQKVAPLLEEFPDTDQLPDWIYPLPCRKCYDKNAKTKIQTFSIEIIVPSPERKPPFKVGFLTIECGELVADGINEEDFLSLSQRRLK